MSTTKNHDSTPLRHCDLYAGIGGFTQAAQQLGEIQTTQFVEINRDAQLILRSHFPNIPIHSDIRDYHPRNQEFDLISCGFPCTGTSRAGKREGLSHPDSALWRHGLRICATVRPQFFITEQPLGVIQQGLRAIIGGFRMVGYSAELTIVRASELGAGHQRARVFVISYPNQWRSLFKIAPRWDNQMREMVQRQRANSSWLTVKRPSDGSNHGISRGLSHSSLTVPTHHPGRIRARYLAGRTVTPAQAAIALSRVLYLSRLSNSVNES
ncbi:DNA cytosine methyltransferase [Coleofasciculus sp.]|uniref:DNA cytosine methyltransferase n=1 Tax=Coleofasciculus sp. TaxID=3100458 RepID=UPI0039F9BB7E